VLSKIVKKRFTLVDMGSCQSFSEDWAAAHLLHSSYWESYSSCTREEWRDWLESERSRITTFAPFVAAETTFWSRKALDSELQRRGFSGSYELPYKPQHFEIRDFNFDKDLWSHWNKAAESNPAIWAQVFDIILKQRPAFWEGALRAKVVQIATTGTPRTFIEQGVMASWVRDFRDLPCLRDSRGVPRKPADLLRRTPATEALLDVEPFVPAEVDTEGNRALLVALGVRNTPTGPTQLVERIRALAESPTPPLDELEKWYRRLDSLLPSCSTTDINEVRLAFTQEPLIYSEDHGWLRVAEVFLSANEEDVPDAPVVRRSVRDLQLWRHLQVAERPSLDLILAWLQELESGITLPTETGKRVKAFLPRHGEAIWRNCGHWINLAGEWMPVSSLTYSVSMRSLTKTQDLFTSIRRVTADFQTLDFEQLDRHPFCTLPSLASCIDERLNQDVTGRFIRRDKPWLRQLATDLERIEVLSESETTRLRETAGRLGGTAWLQGRGLETIPYLDGTPAGPSRRVPAVWSGQALYVEDAPIPALATPIAREIGRGFDHSGIADAIKFCFERDAEFIHDYLEREFKLCQDPNPLGPCFGT
jgi:hypothetical protein